MVQFQTNGKLPRAFTSSFVALVGKKKNLQGLNDFWPISLIGCIYKIIANVLALRLKGVLLGIISQSQTAFLQGTQILDGVLLANEIICNNTRENLWCIKAVLRVYVRVSIRS